MKSNVFILLIINIIIGSLIGHYLGKKRHIGFWWTVFICLSTSVILGIILVLISPKLESPPHKPTKFKKVLGIMMILISILGFLGYLKPRGVEYQNLDSFSGSCLFFTIGSYLYYLSIQKSTILRG